MQNRKWQSGSVLNKISKTWTHSFQICPKELSKKRNSNLNQVKNNTPDTNKKEKKNESAEVNLWKLIAIFCNLTRYNYIFEKVMELQAVSWKCNELHVICYM